jgi:tRNA dimethylallyltransferase
VHGRSASPHPDPGGRHLSQAVRHLALVGCTASGKSSVAMQIARQLGDVEIVAVDSMQVYRGMDIGTAKPTAAEQAEVPHHLLDLAGPGEEWSVTQWVAEARRAVAGIEGRGHRALFVGGTGLYFQALVDRLQPPGTYPAVRSELLAVEDTAALYHRLQRVDAVAATRMESSNRRRIIRALEVTLGSGRPFSSYGPGIARFPDTPWRLAGLWLPRPVVAARISARLATMVEAGLVEEVERLRRAPMSRTARQALGYREILEHFEAGVPLADALEVTDRRTRAFARRQRVWWRRDPRIRWYGSLEDPFAVIPQLLGSWNNR